MAFAMLILFAQGSRIFDYLLVGYRIPAIIIISSFLVAVLHGGLRTLLTRVGMAYVLFTAWLIFVTPFSSWQGGSVMTVRSYLISALIFFPLAGIPRRIRDVSKLFYTAGIAIWVLAAFATFFPREEGGRSAIGAGMYGNANDLALIMCLGLPFWLFIIQQQRSLVFRLVGASLGLLPLFLTLMRTGSRSGILALCCMLVVLFLRGFVVKRATLIVLSGVLLLIAISLIPAQTWSRYQTIMNALPGGQEPERMDEATASAQMRRELLVDSIRMTLENPILGVGPGQFQVVWGQMRETAGIYSKWIVSHNSYTQISSECGIPGLVLFLVILMRIYQAIRDARRMNMPGTHRQWKSGMNLALCLELALVSYVVFAFFLSIGYQVQLFVLGGLAVALQNASASTVPRAPAPARQHGADRVVGVVTHAGEGHAQIR